MSYSACKSPIKLFSFFQAVTFPWMFLSMFSFGKCKEPEEGLSLQKTCQLGNLLKEQNHTYTDRYSYIIADAMRGRGKDDEICPDPQKKKKVTYSTPVLPQKGIGCTLTNTAWKVRGQSMSIPGEWPACEDETSKCCTNLQNGERGRPKKPKYWIV